MEKNFSLAEVVIRAAGPSVASTLIQCRCEKALTKVVFQRFSPAVMVRMNTSPYAFEIDHRDLLLSASSATDFTSSDVSCQPTAAAFDVDLIRPGCTRNHTGDFRLRSQPAHGEFEQRVAMIPGKYVELLDHVEISIRERSLAPLAEIGEPGALGRRGTSLILAGEQAVGERENTAGYRVRSVLQAGTTSRSMRRSSRL